MSAVNQFDEQFFSIADGVTRDQFYGRAQTIKTPEDRLLLQVLALALSDAHLDAGSATMKQAEISRQARQWIMSDDTGLMSCRMICDALGVNIETLRRRMAAPSRMRSRHLVT